MPNTGGDEIGGERLVRDCPEINECHSTTGQGDYLIKVVTPDIAGYDDFLHKVVFKLPGVSDIRSSVVLREIKVTSLLPLRHLSEGSPFTGTTCASAPCCTCALRPLAAPLPPGRWSALPAYSRGKVGVRPGCCPMRNSLCERTSRQYRSPP
jgi:hypothetical protein